MISAIVGCILAALAVGAVAYVLVKLTIRFLKEYRKRKYSKILVGIVKDIIKAQPTVNLDDLPDKDVIIAEYDEEADELVQDITICSDVDEKVRGILNNNEGIVIFE